MVCPMPGIMSGWAWPCKEDFGVSRTGLTARDASFRWHDEVGWMAAFGGMTGWVGMPACVGIPGAAG